MTIKYIRFVCQPREQFVEPDVDIPYDTYRSFNRGKRSGKQSSQDDATTLNNLYIMQLYPKLILDALAKVRYPGNGKDLVANGMIEDDIRIDGNKVSFSIIFEKPNDPFIRSVVKAAETAILTFVSPDVEIKGNINVKSQTGGPPQPRESRSPA